MSSKVMLNFKTLPAGAGEVAFLTLNRAEVSNALDGEMIRDLVQAIKTVKEKGLTCRLLVLQGAGKNFCAGADLEWMKQSKNLGLEENRKESRELSSLFRGLYDLETPTLAVVQGAAYGGAVGLAACCDVVLAEERAKFCLSEVKVGLVAAVILPFLHLKIHPSFLRRFVLGATVFDAEEGRHAGLVTKVVEGDLKEALLNEVNAILAGEPHVQRAFKRNHRLLLERDSGWWEKQCEIGVETIAAARVSPTGQEGIAAFFEKRRPHWAAKLDTLDTF